MTQPVSATRLIGAGVLGVSLLMLSTLALRLQASAQGGAVLPRASKSSTIAITTDDKYVVMVNPEDDSISVFAANPAVKRATLKTGIEPSSVVIHPDDQTAFVANRADATVVKVSGVNTNTPRILAKVDVGSEPTGLALSPSGARLFVAEWAEGRISVIDTGSMRIVGTIGAPTNPRAVTVTNDGDRDDNDELVIVPEFYGTPGPGPEASDEGRTGLVRVYQLSNLEATPGIRFSPIDSGFVPEGTNAGTVKTSPNQFFAAAVQGNRVFVTSVSASPKGPPRFNGNVFPVVYVADLETRKELPEVTTNLAKKIAEAIPAGKPRNFLADLADISFFGETGGVAYTVSRGADAVQRVVFGANAVTVGSQFGTTIDVGVAAPGSRASCQNPTGIVTGHQAPKAFVNCWVSRGLAVVDLAQQRFEEFVQSTDPPTGKELTVNRGRRFYFTGRGRWSKESWSGCGSCHPDGLSDNITWAFGTGPRQTTDMSGSFSHGPGRQKQRIFNWTAVFEEMHDFERNTRDTSGGLGAVTTSGCGDLNEEQQVNLGGNLDKPVRESQNEAKPSCTKDWDEIDEFVKTIRPPRALRFVDKASVARGEKLFGVASGSASNGGCVTCHGGPGWTISRLAFEPGSAENARLSQAPFKIGAPLAPTVNFNTLQLQTQPPIKDTTTGPEEPAAVGPKQVSCVLRNVGTFGIPGSKEATDALEKKADGTRAQGRGGYNVPSLYGLALGAPYLHHGQARTLEELFTDPRWEGHLRAGNAVFAPNAAQRQDLANFLVSIDADTPEQAVSQGFDVCGR